MNFLGYIKLGNSVSIGYIFEEAALSLSYEIKKYKDEQSSCILFGFYLIFSRMRNKDFLREFESPVSSEVKKKLNYLLDDLGHVCALRVFYEENILPIGICYPHKSFKFDVNDILTRLKEINPKTIVYLNSKTEDFLKFTHLYDTEYGHFYLRFYEYFIIKNKFNKNTSLLWINLIMIWEVDLPANYAYRSLISTKFMEHYKKNRKSFTLALDKICILIPHILTDNTGNLAKLEEQYKGLDI